MDKLVSHSTLARITNVIIKRRHKCLTVGGEEGHCGCGVGVVQGGIPRSACPPTRGAHRGGQYPLPKGGRECWNSGLDGRLEVVAASIHLKVVVGNIVIPRSK
jgi:hypothetical protein